MSQPADLALGDVVEQELDGFAAKLNEALLPLMENEPDEGRRQHKIAVIMHPKGQGKEHE